jgi:APA family basic amino acid/polyamine antiporter
LGQFAHSLYAALSVIILTAMNLMGVQKGKWTQNVLTAIKVIGLLAVVLVGMMASPFSTTRIAQFAAQDLLGALGVSW